MWHVNCNWPCFLKTSAWCFTSLCAGEQGQQHLQHPRQPAVKDGAVRQQLGDPGGGAHPQLPGGEKEVVDVEDNDNVGDVDQSPSNHTRFAKRLWKEREKKNPILNKN